MRLFIFIVLFVIYLHFVYGDIATLASFQSPTASSIPQFAPSGVLFATNAIYKTGNFSGCWNNTVVRNSLRLSNITKNWSTFDTLQFWMYSRTANGASITFVFDSDDSTTTGGDYYSLTVTLTFTGWKLFSTPLSSLRITKSPIGFSRINNMTISSTWFGSVPDATTFICFDNMYLYSSEITLIPNEPLNYYMPVSYSQILQYQMSSALSFSANFSVNFSGIPTGCQITASPSLVSLSAGGFSSLDINITTLSTINSLQSPFQMLLDVRRGSVSVFSLPITLYIVSETVSKQRPFLLIDNSLRSQIITTPWKIPIVQYFINQAIATAATNLTVHKKWGGWQGNFACNDGTKLTYDPNDSQRFYCPSTNTFYTGEPYASSWVSYKHDELADAISNLAISYYFGGNITHGRLAADLLLQYANFYNMLPVIDKYTAPNGQNGGRIMSQTLDESQFVKSTIIAFDLVANLMTSNDRAFIEHNLYRSIARTILKNNDGAGNWQSWHNSAINAIGYSFNDSSMIDFALNSPNSGFLFQLVNSMMDDGIWFENSIGYHYFTLTALQFHVGVSRKQGVSLENVFVNKLDNSGMKSIKLMYSSPIYITLPDYSFPDLNDFTGSSILDEEEFYEFANSAWNDSVFKWTLNKAIGTGNRNLIDSLIYGSDYSNFPSSFQLGSVDYSGMGISVLRFSDSYLLIDYGPHGGTLIFYKQKELISDYGSVGYSLPLHIEYLKRTLSHSTIMIDGNCQIEASGALVWSGNSFSETLSSVVSNLSMIANGVYAFRSLVHIPFSEVATLILDFVETAPSNRNECHETFYILHSSGSFNLDNGGLLTAYPGSLLFGNQEPSWSYLQQPRYVNSVPSTTQLRYSWTGALSYADRFETTFGWKGIQLSRDGNFSGLWQNHTIVTSISKTNVVTDWSKMNSFSFWMYNYVPNTGSIQNATSSGIDYYSYRPILLTWTGWMQFSILRSEMSPTRAPVGWFKIDSITFSATWGNTPTDPNARVLFDSFILYDNNGRELVDPPSSGLAVFGGVTASPKQFITANAPNNPATSYHPVAVTRFGCQDNVMTHLLVGGSFNLQDIISFTATNDVLTSNATIVTSNATFQIQMSRNSAFAPFSNLRADIQSSVQRIQIGYQVISLQFQQLSFTSANRFDIKFLPLQVNSTFCEFSVTILRNAAVATCSLVVPNTNVPVVLINGTVSLQFQQTFVLNSLQISLNLPPDGSFNTYRIYSVQPTTSGPLTTNSVTSGSLTTNSVTSGPLTTNLVTSESLTTSKITSGLVPTAVITSSQLTTSEITTNSITTEELTTSIITTGDDITTGEEELPDITSSSEEIADITTGLETGNYFPSEMTTGVLDETTGEFEAEITSGFDNSGTSGDSTTGFFTSNEELSELTSGNSISSSSSFEITTEHLFVTTSSINEASYSDSSNTGNNSRTVEAAIIGVSISVSFVSVALFVIARKIYMKKQLDRSLQNQIEMEKKASVEEE